MKKRKVPAGPKAVPGANAKGGAASSTRQQSARGIDPSNPAFGILNTTRKHNSAVTQPTGRNVPTGQANLTSKVKRQAY